MKEEALKIFYDWDMEHMNIPIDKNEFKRRINEENDDLIDQVIRDLKDDNLIEIKQTMGSYWIAGNITAWGRQQFPNPYSDDTYIHTLKAIRDFDYEHMDEYMNKSKLKEKIEEYNDKIINYILRDLEYNAYIEIFSSIGDKYNSFRITKVGRDYLKENNI